MFSIFFYYSKENYHVLGANLKPGGLSAAPCIKIYNKDIFGFKYLSVLFESVDRFFKFFKK